jgi:putative DNA primase/helicase
LSDYHNSRTRSTKPKGVRGGSKSPGKAAGVVGVSQTAQLLRITADYEVFHDPGGKAYTTVQRDGHFETHGIHSTTFRQFLQHQYFARYSTAVGRHPLEEALGVLGGRAMFDGPGMPVSVRTAIHDGNFYLDLANEEWEAVQVDSNGWRIISNRQVKFRRSPGMLALPRPRSGGDGRQLIRNLFNFRDDDQVDLVIGWMLGVLRAVGPYSPLVIQCGHDSAKTTTTKFLRHLLDPNHVSVRGAPKDERDLALAAYNGLINVD